MGEGGWLAVFLIAQRLAELVIAQRNTAALRAQGAVEFGASHYYAIVALHAAWLAGLASLGHAQPVSRVGLIIFILLQAARIWTIASLGARWTTRIIVLPGKPPVMRGPYRFVRHPNYMIVVAEIALVPLMLGLPLLAFIFSAINAAVLSVRIRAENAALAGASRPDALANTSPSR